MELVQSFLSSIWDLFRGVDVPGTTLSFAQFWLGVFIVSVSISILRPLLSIGARGAKHLTDDFSRRLK